jgi:DsbC/DsbD-like thiol-disulfide interchange protein
VFVSFGLQTIGYSGQIVLPVVVTPADPAKPMTLAVTADMGVCNEICVLEQFSLGETIAADQQDVGAAQIDRARATVPPQGEAAGLDVAECRITGAGRERHLALRLSFREALNAPVVVVEGAPDVWISDVVSRQSGAGALDVEAKVRLASDSAWINRSDLRMTVLADNMSADIRGCTAPAG